MITVVESANFVGASTPEASVAAHQILLQLWIAISMLADALAIAAQSLVATALPATALPAADKTRARDVVTNVLGLGAMLGVGLGLGLHCACDPLLRLFSRDPEV